MTYKMLPCDMAKGSLKEKRDRQDRLVGLLRVDEIWTSGKLCKELDTSQRTLMRDLEELRAAGLPIESDRGRGGGIRLDGRWGVDRLTLSDHEVINLLVALAISESLQSPLLSGSVKSVRQKIAQSFPPRQRRHLNRLRTRVLIGQPASTEVVANYTPPEPCRIEAVTTSFFNQTRLDIRYCAESRNITDRTVEPQYLLLNWPVWYLCGWDYLRDNARLFRIDRIQKAQSQPGVFALRNRKKLLAGFEEHFASL